MKRVMIEIDDTDKPPAFQALMSWALNELPEMTCATCEFWYRETPNPYCLGYDTGDGMGVPTKPDHFCAAWEARQ